MKNRAKDDVWWINSRRHGYCFWRYIVDISHKGHMEELAQVELANLLGCSNTKAHFLLKEAMEELEIALKEESGEW